MLARLRPSLVALVVVIAGCASAPKDQSSSDDAPVSHAAESPRMNRGGPPPEIRVPITPSNRAAIRVELEVMVDAQGTPDMATFKATGLGAGEHMEALRRWMAAASFRPARLDGRPVPGLFKMKLEATARRR